MVDPRAYVGQSLRLEPVEIADHALETQGGRVRKPHRRIAALGNRQADHEDLGLRNEAHVHGLAVAPQAEQRRLSGGEPDDCLPPGRDIDDDTRPWPMGLDAPAAISQSG